jgi:CBS domain containing-hemolysin-like protein
MALVHRIVELSRTRGSSLRVPWVDFQAFNLAFDRGELAPMFRTTRLLRIPVHEGDIDDVRGVVLAKDFLLDAKRPWPELIRPVHFIPEQAGVEALLQHFRRTFELPLEDARIDTLGGWVGERLGQLPAQGDEVAPGNVRLRVISMRQRRIVRVELSSRDAPRANPDLAVLLGVHDAFGGRDGAQPCSRCPRFKSLPGWPPVWRAYCVSTSPAAALAAT